MMKEQSCLSADKLQTETACNKQKKEDPLSSVKFIYFAIKNERF